MKRTFLKAEWRKLLMANYLVEPSLLLPYLPAKTEIDTWQGNCYLSLVGFMFLNTRLLGIKVPFHTNFEEVNLRFYVRYHDGNEWKRGVVFIKEIVPKPALSLVANTLYGENYQTMPMKHVWGQKDGKLNVAYSWKKNKHWHTMEVQTAGPAVAMEEGSEAEFITEHYWGYTRLNEHKTSEYQVEHPKWLVYPTESYSISVDYTAVYGAVFSFLSEQQPHSVILAEGSEIAVRIGGTL